MPRHALLGVSARPTTDGTAGALVAAVEPGSAADAAGIEVGDVITSLAGDPVESPEQLVAAIISRQPGDAVEVVLRRDGETGHRDRDPGRARRSDVVGPRRWWRRHP